MFLCTQTKNRMWYKLGNFIVKNRLPLLLVLLVATAFMGYEASKVQLSYEFSKAIPTDNIKYREYQTFRAKFGDDGGTLVLGIQHDDFFSAPLFNAVEQLHKDLKKIFLQLPMY